MCFSPYGLRQHRKMIMIDNYIAYTGMNMVDPLYFKQDAGVGQWIDLMARMEGLSPPRWVIYSLRLGSSKTGKTYSAATTRCQYYAFEQAGGHHSHNCFWPLRLSGRSHSRALLTAAYSARECLIADHALLCT